MNISEMRCHSAEDITKMKYSLVEFAEEYISEADGIENVNDDVLAHILSMINCLSEAEMNSVKSCYYETVIDAMGESSDAAVTHLDYHIPNEIHLEDLSKSKPSDV